MDKVFLKYHPSEPVVNSHWRSASIIILAVTTLLVFAPSLQHEFIQAWDDGSYILTNSTAHGFSALHLKTAFSNYYVGNYAPLHIVSYMADYTLWNKSGTLTGFCPRSPRFPRL